ncbi:hypothetical protein BDZ94DRAFT_301740 [Collybia nuda]|uniref:Uncharacterized protein n=1 Tax=Collybia nuda TaxID=64659 RepID=A0A9P6CMB0_9AGAR|nr:hypothetical protein BDZ94DRAFT_301740 [Collybia nuda]
MSDIDRELYREMRPPQASRPSIKSSTKCNIQTARQEPKSTGATGEGDPQLKTLQNGDDSLRSWMKRKVANLAEFQAQKPLVKIVPAMSYCLSLWPKGKFEGGDSGYGSSSQSSGVWRSGPQYHWYQVTATEWNRTRQGTTEQLIHMTICILIALKVHPGRGKAQVKGPTSAISLGVQSPVPVVGIGGRKRDRICRSKGSYTLTTLEHHWRRTPFHRRRRILTFSTWDSHELPGGFVG